MDAWKELFKAISENIDRGYQAAERRQASEVKVNSALDMAVLRYKQEKEKQEKRARLYSR